MNPTKKKPLLRGYFHEWMFFISIGACIPLISKSTNPNELIATIVYSIGIFMMFGFSALYHRINWRPKVLKVMRRLDHSSIFIMIAGSFTPICLLVLPDKLGLQLLLIIWIIAGIGIIQTVLFTNTPRMVRAGIYLIAGYMAIPYLSVLSSVMGFTNYALTVAGGTIYSVGAIGYGLKFPDFSPKYFGYHEFFHILVSVAAILHFIVIYSIVG
ncbi:hemolysin III family protein [Gammaproteobacteria bacterium]|nr:hemolysin III family protein [Gammaproteobacteria bacterium]MDA9342708.1 hemolysin III family protein [Gammaproteobacteria bacterium]MDB2582854.1 hemolysin III family protein [Gammaproteobacteria bacterium]MDB4158508.1 hemolysin III family protein [Gammaproteobacteria bacterium]MDB9747499.1 hemolysin III family protein [Gammaproteobacteria bacterium]